ncbi:MAG: DapH/DapD/GlmU-related protein [Phycisphaerales bacterium]
MAEVQNTGAAYIHPQAIVETPHIGPGTRIRAFAHVLQGVRIGRDCNLCDHTFVEGGVVIGDNVTIKCGVYLWDGLILEDNVFLGPNATFTNDIRPRSKAYPGAFTKTRIHVGASVGANATVVCGVTIGCWAMIGAGSVVTRDVPDHALVYGNPARMKGYVCRCAADLVLDGSTSQCGCGQTYVLEAGGRVRRG